MAGQVIPDDKDSSSALTGAALVIEDDALIALDVQDMMESAGFGPVVLAHTAEDAEALAHNAYTIAIVDIKLAHGDSTAAVHALRARGTPFIVTTGYAEPFNVSATFAGAPRLTKPFEEAELHAALRAALKKSAAR